MIVGAAFADGTAAWRLHDTTLLVEDGRVADLWHDGSGPDPASLGVSILDGSGARSCPGWSTRTHTCRCPGAQWIQRGFDPAEELLAVGEENGEAMVRAGIRWARDVGAPRGTDGRALSLALRDRWAGRADRPYIRAAGTWVTRTGALPDGVAVEVDHAADLSAAVGEQLDAGADLVKLYLDGPDANTAPFSTAEVRAAVELAHGRGARVAAHSSTLPGARVCVGAGVDSIEHGFTLDADAASTLAANGVTRHLGSRSAAGGRSGPLQPRARRPAQRPARAVAGLADALTSGRFRRSWRARRRSYGRGTSRCC